MARLESKKTEVKGKIKDYFVKVFNGMALGLFSSLLIGLIIKQLGTFLNIEMIIKFGSIAQVLMGPAIGAGVAYSVGAPPLGIFASVITGAIGAGSITFGEGGALLVNIGEPVGAFVAGLLGAEFSKLIKGKTKVDIVLVPLAYYSRRLGRKLHRPSYIFLYDTNWQYHKFSYGIAAYSHGYNRICNNGDSTNFAY